MGIFFENVIARQSFPFNNHPLKATLLHYKHFRKAVAFAFWKLEQLRLSLVNEMPTNSCTGPRLLCYLDIVLIKTTSYLVDEKIKKTVPFETNKYIKDV